MTDAEEMAARLRDYRERFIFQGGSNYANTLANMIETSANAMRVLGVRDSLHKIAIKERNAAWVEVERLKAELAALQAERDALRKLFEDAVPWLIEVARMPNAEHVADAHNAAVRKLRAAIERAHGIGEQECQTPKT